MNTGTVKQLTIPACLADLAFRTLPASADNRIDLNSWVQAVSMIMLTTTGAK